MRIHHCGAENGLIPPNEKFKKKKHCFHVPLCPFKYEKKYLEWIKSYDITCHFEAENGTFAPKKDFFRKNY